MRASEKYFFSRTIFLGKLIYCGGRPGQPVENQNIFDSSMIGGICAAEIVHVCCCTFILFCTFLPICLPKI